MIIMNICFLTDGGAGAETCGGGGGAAVAGGRVIVGIGVLGVTVGFVLIFTGTETCNIDSCEKKILLVFIIFEKTSI